MSRRVAREIILKLLFQINFHKEDVQGHIDTLLQSILEEKIHDDKPLGRVENSDVQFIKGTVKGTMENIENIDKKIEELALGWTLDRIAKVDLAILRLAVFEIIYNEDIPNEVAINEAVELAKKYSTEESKVFINGILGNVVK
jgi:N utilization substance protein B